MLYTQAITWKEGQIQKKKLRVLNEFSYRGLMTHLHQSIQRHHQNGANVVALELHAGRKVWTIHPGEIRKGAYTTSPSAPQAHIACLNPPPDWEPESSGLHPKIVESLGILPAKNLTPVR